MPNIAQALKQEISRVARKELRVEQHSLKKGHAQSRGDIAGLKKRVAELERMVARLASGKRTQGAAQPDAQSGRTFRFSPTRLLAHRQRLALSAADMGMLLDVSALSVYKWESGTVRPRVKYLAAISALRTLNKAQAAKVIESRR